MNKKASMDAILNFIRLLFVIVVFFSVITLTRAFIIQNIDIFETETKLLAHRLVLSKHINYIDNDINREYVGIIDLQKFVSGNIEQDLFNSIYYGSVNSEASAKLTLKDLEDNKQYEVFYNKELYNEKKVLVEAKLIGIGAARSLDTTFYVLINDKDKLKKGVLTIEAILPNR